MSELEFWKDLGNIFDAVMNYQKKNVEFNNRFINPWIRLGNVFERQDQANDAVQAYKRATEIAPDAAENWVELGDAQFKTGEYDQAIEAYSKAVTLDPEAGWPLGNLALSLVTQGKIEEAIPLYKKSIDLLTEVKDKAICWNRLGNAYRKINDYENAFHAFQAADQLDGDNTGFSDKLDEAQPTASMVAPEEVLEQMVMAQESEEAESTTLEVMSAPAEETSTVETEPAEIELPVADATPLETAEELVVLMPNMEMVVEENQVEEEAVLPLNEVVIDEPTNETVAEVENTPLTLHEKKFDLLQIVENVIARVERAYAEQKSSHEEQVSAKVEPVAAISQEPVQEVEPVAAVSEEAVQEVEAVAAVSEETVQETEVVAPVSEDAVQEVEAVAAVSEEAVQEVEPVVAVVEEVAQEIEAVTAVSEEAVQEVEPVAAVSEEAVQEVEVVATVSEETVQEAEAIEAVTAELNEEAAPEVETPVVAEVHAEEPVSEVAPRRIPEWLVIPDTAKVEEKLPVAETEAQQTLAQIESVTTLSDISQEAAVSESAVNMDIVETYTDPLAAQLTTEPDLSAELISSEASTQVEAECEAVVETPEIAAVDESNPVVESAVAEESSTVITDERVAELAYEEYLKDMVEPVNALKDHMEEIQGEAPATKISKNGEDRIAMDTKNAHVWNELGNIYLNAGTYDDAIASYSKAIELDRHFAWPYSNLALAYVQKGRFAEAILLYQRGIELFTLDRDKAITWNRLGNVYRRINDYSNAIASYQTADELDPENATLSLRSSFGLLGNMYSESKPAFVA